MTYYPLLTLVTLATFFAAALAASLAVSFVWRVAAPSLGRLGPAARARLLLTLRALPAATGIVSALLAGSAFARHEPRGAIESPGLLLLVLASAAAAFFALVAARAARAIVRTATVERLARRCARWTSPAGTPVTVVQSAYPVAAIVGLFRSRFVVSTRILAECSAEEIELILAHERAHLSRRDNMARALIAMLPDPLAGLGAAAAIDRGWTSAAEEAADADAAGANEDRRAALAGVLVRIARLADTAPPAWMPALSFYQGGDLQRRVGALLRKATPGEASRPVLRRLLAACAVTGAIAAYRLSEDVHGAIEWAIHALP